MGGRRWTEDELARLRDEIGRRDAALDELAESMGRSRTALLIKARALRQEPARAARLAAQVSQGAVLVRLTVSQRCCLCRRRLGCGMVARSWGDGRHACVEGGCR